MLRFSTGDFLPVFLVDSSIGIRNAFDLSAGGKMLLAFVGSFRTAAGRAVAERLIALRPKLRALDIRAYAVTADRADADSPVVRELARDVVLLWDFDGEVHRRYGMDGVLDAAGSGGAFLIRMNLRCDSFHAFDPTETFERRILDAAKRMPGPSDDMHAPVLMVPGVFEPAFCGDLIRYYKSQQSDQSGFMRDVDGKTTGFLDPTIKVRRDVHVADDALLDGIGSRLWRRLLPEIKKAFDCDAQHIERYLVACYDSREGGHFDAHRDNVERGTRHRQFAASITLDSDGFEGGELCFPEYGSRRYKPATGDAVVFSCSLLHTVRPVTSGRRYVFLPFLYDRAHSNLRRENAKYIEGTNE